MKTYLFLFFTLLFSHLGAQTIVDNISWDGLDRSYRIYLPAGYEDGMSLPLVFNFHGFTSNATQQQFYSEMDKVADTANFLVVYPQGIDDAWNVGWTFGSTADDVGFTNALIDTLHAQYNINLDRVYACGMSNGGFFSYRLACELSDRIAKVASVTGSMFGAQVDLCMPDRAVPIMQIHGTADPVVGYGGTPGVNISIEQLLENWRDLNGCEPVSDTILIPDISFTDLSTAQLIQYRDCDDEVIMAFYKIANGGHTWPGAPVVVGVTNYDFHASVEIWNFFNDQYPQEQIVSSSEPLFAQPKLKLYPNPIQDQLTIDASRGSIQALEIIDPLGKTIYKISALSTASFTIKNINWPRGVYLVQIYTDLGAKTLRVIKR